MTPATKSARRAADEVEGSMGRNDGEFPLQRQPVFSMRRASRRIRIANSHVPRELHSYDDEYRKRPDASYGNTDRSSGTSQACRRASIVNLIGLPPA